MEVILQDSEATSYWWECLEDYEEVGFESLRNLECYGNAVYLVNLSDSQIEEVRKRVFEVLLEKNVDKLGKDTINWLKRNDLIQMGGINEHY